MTEQTASHSSTTQGVHHVGLTVPDLPATVAFFTDALGHQIVGTKPDYPAVFVSDGTVMITLWQAAPHAASFDRHRQVGLHHLALRVQDLEALAERLADTPGVVLEFAPEALGSGGARHMMCAIPGGVRVEFIALPAAR